MEPIIEDLNAIMCFARNHTQTPNEVFDMMQERMWTMLGQAYSDKGLSLINWHPSLPITIAEMEMVLDWQKTSEILSAAEFDRFGKCVGLSITDVIGQPDISPAQKSDIEQQFSVDVIQGCINPAIAFVTLLMLEEFDDMVDQRRLLSNTPQAS